jgi:hypothetical protein
MTYQLRRLRLHGMIERLPNTQCYHVTQTGFRAALFFTRAYNRLLRPGLAAALPGHRATPIGLKQAFDKIDARLTASINQLAVAAIKLDTFTSYVSTQAELAKAPESINFEVIVRRT